MSQGSLAELVHVPTYMWTFFLCGLLFYPKAAVPSETLVPTIRLHVITYLLYKPQMHFLWVHQSEATII